MAFLDETGVGYLWNKIKSYVNEVVVGASSGVTGVKGDKETSYRSGNVNLTPANIGALPLTGGTLTGALNGTSAAFSGSLTVGGKNVSVEGHSHSEYALSSHSHSEYALSSHSHSYLPLSGGTLTGALKVNGTVTATKFVGKLDGNLYAGDALVATVSGDSTGILYPRADGNGALGSTSKRWYSINAMILRTYDETTTSNGVNARIYSNRVYRYSSSSERYKHDIEPITAEEIAPERLYDAEVVQFKYNDGYLMDGDPRSNTLIPGFIVEKLKEVYPIAIDYNDDGTPEMWNANIMIPPILKLVQDLNKRLSAVERSKKEN